MKFKIKMNEADFVTFVLFSIGLFYLCCLLVLNFISLSQEFTFWGLNPLPALSLKYLPGVILLYIGMLVFGIASVKDTIFQMDKGFGLEVSDQTDKRWSKWEDHKTAKKKLAHVKASEDNYEAGGVPIITDGNDIYLDTGAYHSLTLGTTGSGKTESMIKPMIHTLIKAGESMIVTDPKGEIFEECSNILRAKGYNVVLLNFREPQKGNMWNPLALPYHYYEQGNVDKAIELVNDVAANILHEEKTNEAFWSHAAGDYFTGLAIALFEDAEKEEINLNSISLMSMLGVERGRGGSYLQEYFKSKNPSGAAYINATGTVNAPNETQASILSTFNQKMKIYLNTKNLSEMLSRSDFDMADIGRKKTAVFMIIHDEKTLYHPLASTFVQQCYESLIDVAQQNGGPLPIKTNFILDEFANMPPLSSIGTMITAARSRKIRFHLVIQSYSQLNDVYGKEKADTIKSNCNINIYLLTTELDSLEEVSKLFGEKKAKKDDKESSVPLISINELQRLPMGTALISITRRYPIKAKWPPNSDYKYNKIPFPKQKVSDIVPRAMQPERLFNIKDYVHKMREKNMQDVISGTNGPGFNPFSDFGSQNNAPQSKPPFDMDALMSKLDKRIAELEEEDKNTSTKKETKLEHKTGKPSVLEIKESIEQETKVNFQNKQQLQDKLDELIGEKPKKSAQPKLEVKNEDKEINYQEIITDDQFFDDFFAD